MDAATTSPNTVIRLVGGPRGMDGCLLDLAMSPQDRADLDGEHFVRALCGSTVTPLAALQRRCTDRRTAEQLAATWRAVVFRAAGRPRRHRPRPFRYQGTYSLEAGRDENGRWGLAVAARLNGGPPPAPPTSASTWAELESLVDEAAARFAAVANLLPDGPLAERARSIRKAVGSCVSDAARLCAVGSVIAPDPETSAPHEQVRALRARVEALTDTIEVATAHLVGLHLEVGEAADPVIPSASLAQAWSEIGHPV